MTVRGADLLGQADLASLAQASGIALESYRRAHVSACVARALARHEAPSVADLSGGRVDVARRGGVVSEAVRREGRPVLRWERRDLLREPPPPGAFDLVLCRKVAA